MIRLQLCLVFLPEISIRSYILLLMFYTIEYFD